eukprot:Seg2305.3 transcript_id=Seg2305.3/GoldUCD/mRNA.D3Y31 product="putative transposase-like protein" protein_id=Seg2305.3/GoldUCD/D3Y31
MADFSCQANTVKKKMISHGNQVGASAAYVDAQTQIGDWKGSYGRCKDKHSGMNYKRLLREVLYDKEVTIVWLRERDLLASQRKCDFCHEDMVLANCSDRSDGVKWVCRKQKGHGKHQKEQSIRKGSWFEQSNFTLEEILEYTYLWTQGMEQNQIRREVGCSRQSSVDWSMFCRETCEIVVYDQSEPIGGRGARVQIDESKFGKRKYHRGHRVEGQWVFGGIEEESRKCFMVPVEKRDRKTLLPLIEKWILPGTTIVSDCWKPYEILSELDFEHLKVNHSKEFVNENGDHTNKIEGHWRQAKASFPKFGIRKKYYSSYLGEFIWRYWNKGQNLFETFMTDIKHVYNPCEF